MEKFPISHHDLLTKNTTSSTTSTSSNSTTLSSSSASNSMATNNHIFSQCFSIYKPPYYCYQYPSQMHTLFPPPSPPPPPPHHHHHQQGLVQFRAGSTSGPSFAVPSFMVGQGQSHGAVNLGVANTPAQLSTAVLMSKEQERRLVDAWMTKAARTKRKLARQRSLNSTRNSTISSSNSNSNYNSNSSVNGVSLSQRDNRSEVVLPISSSNLLNGNNNISTVNRDLYTFCTPDNKRLRALLKKELKNSDVGSLGRIVLPKREAEEKLPILSDKEGIQVLIRDVYSNQEWSLRYKYWSNNKSRMYVLENTGDFVKQNGLVIGDSITLYEDECKNLYVSIKKVERAATSEASGKLLPDLTNQTTNDNNSPTSDDSSSKTEETYDNLYANFAYNESTKDDDETSLALLIEQLNQKEQQEASTLVTHGQLDQESASNCVNVTSKGKATQPPVPAKVEAVDDHLDDCYGGLGTLPEVDRYRYYSYATLFDRMMSDKS